MTSETRNAKMWRLKFRSSRGFVVTVVAIAVFTVRVGTMARLKYANLAESGRLHRRDGMF